MERDDLKKLLKAVRAGRLSVTEAFDRLRTAPMRELAHASLDIERAVRRGFPEVVFGAGKTPDQIEEIVRESRRARQTVLVTRIGPEIHDRIAAFEPRAEYHPLARALVIRQGRKPAGRPGVVVMTAGTADLPVAEEAAVTAEVLGNKVIRIRDVGVAGLHRLMAHRDTLARARVVVVVAGMDGALPSVVGGITDCPVIGVPTSIGYGSGAGGRAALLTMLNSCAAGVTVVNIDNGFGGGFAAGLINRKSN